MLMRRLVVHAKAIAYKCASIINKYLKIHMTNSESNDVIVISAQ